MKKKTPDDLRALIKKIDADIEAFDENLGIVYGDFVIDIPHGKFMGIREHLSDFTPPKVSVMHSSEDLDPIPLSSVYWEGRVLYYTHFKKFRQLHEDWLQDYIDTQLKDHPEIWN